MSIQPFTFTSDRVTVPVTHIAYRPQQFTVFVRGVYDGASIIFWIKPANGEQFFIGEIFNSNSGFSFNGESHETKNLDYKGIEYQVQLNGAGTSTNMNVVVTDHGGG